MCEERIFKMIYRHISKGGTYQRHPKIMGSFYSPYKQSRTDINPASLRVFVEVDGGDISVELLHYFLLKSV
jgi:hypothetical protein